MGWPRSTSSSWESVTVSQILRASIPNTSTLRSTTATSRRRLKQPSPVRTTRSGVPPDVWHRSELFRTLNSQRGNAPSPSTRSRIARTPWRQAHARVRRPSAITTSSPRSLAAATFTTCGRRPARTRRALQVRSGFEFPAFLHTRLTDGGVAFLRNTTMMKLIGAESTWTQTNNNVCAPSTVHSGRPQGLTNVVT